MSILLFGQIERKLVVYGEIIVAGPSAGIPMVVIGGVTFFTVITSQTLGTAITLPCVLMTKRCLTIALTFLTGPTINRITPVACLAFVTIGTIGQMVAGLQASFIVWARTMSITLTTRTVSKVPSLNGTFNLLVGPTIPTG